MPFRPSSRSLALVAVIAVLGAACGGSSEPADDSAATDTSTDSTAVTEDEPQTEPGSGPEGGSFDGPLTVIVPNSPGTIALGGPQRVMTALIGEGPNDFLGGPDQPVTVVFTPAGDDGAGESNEAPGEWLTTNASSLGLYVSYFEFPAAGAWEVRIEADGMDLGGALVEVVPESAVPNVGDPAPATDSPTGGTPEEIAAISTDPDPLARFYELSIADAVSNDRPTVVVFATPAFCQTALCGPTIEFVKGAVDGRDGLDVVHVEPFDLDLAPQGVLEPIPSMADWGLVTEPWVFVVDGDGMVTATFEGIIGQTELEAALDRL